MKQSLKGTKPLPPPAIEVRGGAISNQKEIDAHREYAKQWELDNMPDKEVDTQYFHTPVEDIRVGYECEVKNNSKWIKVIINAFDLEENSIGTYDNGSFWLSAQNLRTSYLTKDEIEAEGWKESEDTPEFFDKIGNDRWYINWEPLFHWLTIWDNEGHNGFSGKCPSINEFRDICRLLEIGTSFGI